MATREKVAKMTEEEFNVQRKSVYTQIAEKDKNMGEESSRFWKEISTHNYDFDRQQKEIDTLETITLDDFKKQFEQVFFSKHAKRLDLELTSVKHKYEQAEYIAKNVVDPYFVNHLKRRIFPGDITEFKKQAKFLDDVVKNNFMKHKGVFKTNKPILGYWGIRGLGSNIRF